MPYSQVKKLWEKDQRLVNLEVIDLACSTNLTEVPNLSRSLKIVNINLHGCESLVEISLCFQHLNKLTHLDLGYCMSLEYLPEMPKNIEFLDLQSSGIKKLPGSIWSLEKISYLDISHCKDLEKLPRNRCKLRVSSSFNLVGCISLHVFSELPRDISKLSLVGFKRLVSLPTNICELKYLEELNLSSCFKLENFPEILEPMENLKSLNLSETTVKELHSSIEFLPALKRIELQGCKRLSSIPKSICKLKYLEELNLSRCFELENFPEILEPMEHLESLCLNETAVKEIHSSIEFFPALKKIELQSCKRFSSIPKSICKLKYLEKHNLSRCSVLENFPEILEPMEHLKSLNLSGTVVGELHSSIEFLPAVEIIELEGCKSLSSIPENICTLKYLERLDLKGCSRFSKFPEILKPMKHLVSLSLQRRALKMLPSSIENLTGLQTLDLSGCKHLQDVPTSIYSLTNLKSLNFYACRELEILPSSSVGFLSLEVLNRSYSGILEIPDGLVCSTSLRNLSLSRTKIRSIPASIKQASRLSKLDLVGCKQLQSLPELPVLCNVEAQGCTSLKTVSSSRTAHTQCWVQYGNFCKYFSNCPKLDNNARSNIMDEAQIKIMQVATTRPLEYRYWPLFSIVCTGNEIPNWFSYQSEGSSVNIKLRPDSFQTGLLGFALSAIVSGVSKPKLDLIFRANFIVKFTGESHELFTSEFFIPINSRNDYSNDQLHVYVWIEAFRREEVGRKCTPDFYRLANEASADFCPLVFGEPSFASHMKVERCGICPLYAEDARKFKFDHVFMLREPKVEETRQDDDSKGGGSSDEAEASGSSD